MKAITIDYNLLITDQNFFDPEPYLSLGLEIGTSLHTYQIFCGNYYSIIPQRNNMFNSNNYEDGEFLIGFNIARLWN